MDNEKLLSNDELLNVTGGSNFLSTSDLGDSFDTTAVLTMKYGIYYSKNPFQGHAVMLYAVRPQKTTK